MSIGLPVYNGEAFLDAALASILAQDFTDFEVIVSDNASTDGTAALCARWAERDRRVRVARNATNIGLEPNFNRTFELARGRYFRWAASDDLIAPDYLGRCVARLEATPDAVLCQSWVHVIDHEGELIGPYDGGVLGAESHDQAERFAAVLLTRHLCTHIFGVMRSDALRSTRLLERYHGSDRATLAELALLGRFVHVPSPLFMNREHPDRGSRGRHAHPAGWSGLPTLLLHAAYRQAVDRHVTDPRVRARCRRYLLQWWLTDWNYARLGVEAVAGVFPSVETLVQRLKLRFYGPLPQVTRAAPPGSGADDVRLPAPATTGEETDTKPAAASAAARHGG